MSGVKAIKCDLCGHVISVGNKAAGRGLLRSHMYLHERGYFGGVGLTGRRPEPDPGSGLSSPVSYRRETPPA